MIRFLLWGLLLYGGFQIIALLKRTGSRPDDLRQGRGTACTAHRDPVCRVYVTEEDAVTETRRGQTYYFCSPACRDRFREHPEHT